MVFFGHEINKFSNFPCRFLNPKYFFSNLNYIFCNVSKSDKTSRNSLKSILFQKLYWRFTVWINVLEISIFFCKFEAFSLESQKFFSICKTIFSHSWSGQFWKKSTISSLHVQKIIFFHICKKFHNQTDANI